MWWKLVDRQRVFQMLAFSLLIGLMGSTLDIWGVKLGLWGYPIKLYFVDPGLAAVDWAFLPLLMAQVYQRCPEWRRFFLVMMLLALVCSFLGQPVLVWTGICQLHGWKYYYSLPLYMVAAVLARWMTDLMTARSLPASDGGRRPLPAK